MAKTATKTAVVLFNLGGPDSPEAVQPFLFNLFNDPAIINAPKLIRWLLAQFISRRRAPFTKKFYAHLGGKSPLLDLTNAQADALENELNNNADRYRVFIAMRYWHPMSAETARAVKNFEPDEIVLLPLYPQYSTTTTGSSLWAWQQAAALEGLFAPTFAPCCYATHDGLKVGGGRNGADDTSTFCCQLNPPSLEDEANTSVARLFPGSFRLSYQIILISPLGVVSIQGMY